MINLLTFIGKVGDSCNDVTNGAGSFFGFPHWYEYLAGVEAWIDPSNPRAGTRCVPQLSNFSDIWLIAAAVIEILLRVAAIVAVMFVIYGGFNYMTSQGEPDATGRAKTTVVNALIGLAIAVSAAALVSFIAGRIT